MKRRNGVQKYILLAGILLLGANGAWAGWYDAPTTLKFDKVTVAPRDAGTATVSFDVRWDNSWRHEVNHDAAWVFFKVKPAGSTEWRHLRLAADPRKGPAAGSGVLNPTGYAQKDGTPLEFLVPDDRMGVFLRRAEFGQGNVQASGLTVVADLDATFGNLKPETRNLKPEVSAFGMEMVYIPEGPFLLGWDNNQSNSFYMCTDGNRTDVPYRITASGAIPTGKQKGKLWALGAQPEDGGEIPAEFPNGYAAIYYMKSHIKAGPYACFLNTLPPARAAALWRQKTRIIREGTAPDYVYGTGSGDPQAWSHHHEWLNWPEAAAYAAWAGLRPMTELEYEKAMRGPMEPGWAQGTPKSHEIGYPSYWGMFDSTMWMTWAEHPVTVANAKGRGFKGTHGSGTSELPADWPQADGIGSGTRGGWDFIHPSNRKGAADPVAPERRQWYMWRGVRNAPKEAALPPVANPDRPVAGDRGAAEAAAVKAAEAATPSIENVKLAVRDGQTAALSFDIGWTNSWRHGRLHDAVWVFFRVKPDAGSDWQPVRLRADRVINPTGFASGDGTALEFVVPPAGDGAGGTVGMFVRRAADGNGTVAARGVTAVVEWGENIQHPTSNTQRPKAAGAVQPAPKGAGVEAGHTQLNTEHRTLNTDLRGFGIEMAYVAEGPFTLGAGAEDLNGFHAWPLAKTPYRVTNAGPIPTGRQDGRLWAMGMAPEDGGELSAIFPKGYRAFYCMKKLDFTQALYAGFLNTIGAADAAKHWYRDFQGVAIVRSGQASNHVYAATDANARSPWLSWADGLAVAAWAGLRPITELEYEKAIRGSYPPSGSKDVPISFWGLSDVSTSEVYDRTVSAGSDAGRRFAGTHGDGTLKLPADWPADPDCIAYRGDYAYDMGYQRIGNLCTSGRIKSITCDSNRRHKPFAGWRAARTAPVEAGEPVGDRFAGGTATAVPRVSGPVRLDAGPEGWGKPIAALVDCADVYPAQHRFAPNVHTSDIWQGPNDMSANVYFGSDGTALCIGAVVTDDKHVNTRAGDTLWNGDALQFGLVNPKGVHFNVVVALTTNGVAMHQFVGEGDALTKTAERSVVRDDKAKLTRYGLRIPLAAVGLKPGDEFAFNCMFIDGDSEKGMRYNLQMAPGIAYPFKTEWYPRFVLKE